MILSVKIIDTKCTNRHLLHRNEWYSLAHHHEDQGLRHNVVHAVGILCKLALLRPVLNTHKTNYHQY